MPPLLDQTNRNQMVLNWSGKEDENRTFQPILLVVLSILLSSVWTLFVLLENHNSFEIHDVSLTGLASPCTKDYLGSIGCLFYAVFFR